jgi:hypothetical protein
MDEAALRKVTTKLPRTDLDIGLEFQPIGILDPMGARHSAKP